MLQHLRVATQVAFFCLGLTLSSLGAAAQEQPTAPAWRTAVAAELGRREYDFQAQPGGVWSAPNRAHDLRSRVSAAGIELARRAADGAPEWRVALRTSAFGRAGACEPLGASVLAAHDERVELDHGRLEEWFENRPDGLDQGWTIATRPPGSGVLWIELELDGDLQFCVDDSDRAGEWLDAAGRTRLSYAHLHAFDANGRELDTRMERTSAGLRIEVDDAGACYPLTVDPLFEDPDWSVESNQASSYFGDCVAGAGDVDGDGFDDVLVGATFFDNGQVDEGRVYLFRGSAAGLATSPAWVVESNVPGPGGSYTEFGHFVAGAGDVNGDGFDDVLVGARRWNDGEHAEGRVFLYLGSASGLAGSAAWSTTSNVVDGHLGSVAGAGDVNGDGYDDVLLGAFGYDGGLHGEGAAFLYLGSSAGLGSAWDWQALGGQTDGFFGSSVASAGDVNGDGLDDVIVGAPGYSSPESSEGAAFVYLGTPTGLGALPAWSAEGDQSVAIFGEGVAGVGDVDGDGFDDVLVGARYFDVGGSNEGRVFLYRGSASGLGLSPAWTKDGTQLSSEFGHSVAGAGDVNGDGFDDVLVGSYRYSNPQASEGAAFLFLGSTTGLGARAAWRAEGQQAAAAFGHSVAGAGDVNDDGLDDWIVSALFYSNGQSNEGAAFAYLGSEALSDSRWYVDRDALGENTGLSWADAFTDLQSALAVAVAGEEIWVAEGTYRPTAGGDRALSFQMKSGIAIYGGFAAIETERTQRNPLAHVTILSGDLLGNDAPGFANYDDNSRHVVAASGVNLTAVLDGFTIRGGSASGSGFDAYGGGVLFLYASPTLTNCVIEANQAPSSGAGGGGLASIGGAALISDCRLRLNRAFRGGGAFLRGNTVLSDCTVEYNLASEGGGVLASGRETLDGCTLEGNVALGQGGGGLLCTGDARVVDTEFLTNMVTSTTGRGGAVLVSAPRASFQRGLFQANRAPHSGGGMISAAPGQLSVDSCSFLQNWCSFQGNTSGVGGALMVSWGTIGSQEVRILASEFRDNTALQGGALYLASGKPVVVSSNLWRNRAAAYGGAVLVTGLNETLFRNCSIALNSAGYRGGGLLTFDPNMRASNCILWGNTAPFNSQLLDSTGLATIARCQVQFGWPGLNSSLDPLFVSLAGGDLRLQAGSPCIDSGNNTVVPSWAGSDFDHRPRFHDDPATVDTGAGTAPFVDRGAHEYGSPTVCPADCDGDGQCDAFEISSGADTDLNANEIPDGCDGKALEPALGSGQSVTLLPDGGAGNPTLEPVVELENQFGPGGSSVAVVQSERDLHPGAGGYGTLGKTVTVETSLLDGEFWMRVSIPFSLYDLAGMSWSSIDLLYFDVDAQQWELAASANTAASPGHPGPVGDRFALAGTTLPVLSSELGDHGVFWNSVTQTGFAWANVDHTTDFSGGFAFGAFPDCNGNGIEDLLDLQAGGVDCNGNALLDTCELVLGLAADCDANGIPDFCDIVAGRQRDCNLNGVPDACDLSSGTSLDVFPSGGDGIPDDCQLGFKRLGASAPGFGGTFPR